MYRVTTVDTVNQWATQNYYHFTFTRFYIELVKDSFIEEYPDYFTKYYKYIHNPDEHVGLMNFICLLQLWPLEWIIIIVICNVKVLHRYR